MADIVSWQYQPLFSLNVSLIKQAFLVGLFLYALGSLLFVPSGMMMAFWAFLLSYFIMTCGLSFLETSSNPYVLAMGSEETSTQRLNFAQSFNPLGSITGMLIASQIILVNLNTTTEVGRQHMQNASDGKPYHLQLDAKAIGMLDQAQKTIKNTGYIADDQKAISSVMSNIDGAKNYLTCLDPKISNEAAQLKAELAKKDIEKEKRFELRSSLESLFNNNYYGNDKELLDFAVLASSEIPVLDQVAPDALNKNQAYGRFCHHRASEHS